jgi:hypothetical protein
MEGQTGQTQIVAEGYSLELGKDPRGADAVDDAHATASGTVSIHAEVWLSDVTVACLHSSRVPDLAPSK